MKGLPEKQFFILERFVELNELPTNSESFPSLKKIVLLKNIYTEQKCVMKIQPKQLLESKDRNVLHQASFFQKFQGHLGIPLMIWSGQDFDCLVLILEQLGFSIYERLKFYCSEQKMRLKDVCTIGIQLFEIINNFHQKDYIHRNITPQTFCFGRAQKITKIYVNDLLYMKKYRAKNNLNHIQLKENVRMQFLTPFMSLNVLKGFEASRRDDVISIVYVLIYLLKGKLPWLEDWQEDIMSKSQEIKQINQKQQVNLVFRVYQKDIQRITAKVNRMKKIHESVSSDQLCQGLPRQFKQILDMVTNLEFTQEPEYLRYETMLKKVLFRNKMKIDHLYEWMESQENMEKNLFVHQKPIKLQTEKQRNLQTVVYEPFQQQINLEASYEEKLKKQVRKSMYGTESLQESRKIKEAQRDYINKKQKHCQLI